jgi:GT2 family glycosyltransferase
MDLSVIIVNYKSYACLQNCIASLALALVQIDAEIIVVDNDSEVLNLLPLQQQFPLVKWLVNTKNEGFSRANNQALSQANGDYILFLNPDTVVSLGIFETLIQYFGQHKMVGAVGVQMENKEGKFLAESKRSFPTSKSAFFKMCGLAKLFPRSAYFNAYALGHLAKDKIHIVDVLAGAFMMVPKAVLTQIGGFDNRFFMYAEDIDFCYRIQELGYEIHYIGTQKITHLKGGSTNKHTETYRKYFYGSMELFVKKYSRTKYSLTEKWILIIGIRLARYLAAVRSFLVRFFYGEDIFFLELL